jgi:hypothetical protein
MINPLIQTLAQKPRTAFLLDGAGALLTAVLPLVIVYLFGNVLGMPLQVLYLLSGIASLFALYSFSCAYINPARWRPYLRFISIANLAYCCLTLGLMWQHRAALFMLGVAYFGAEILVVLLVVYVERKIINASMA